MNSDPTQLFDRLPPVVRATFPEAGCTDVPPGLVELRVTFSKEMMDQSWSWSTAWGGSTPAPMEMPRFDTDRKTCVLVTKLEPGKAYGFWLNSRKFRGFRDRQGRAAVPYLFSFRTRAQG